MNDSDGHPLAALRRRRWARWTILAGVAAAALGCTQLVGRLEPPGLPPPVGEFFFKPDAFIDLKGGLCIGQSATVGACASPPRPKFDIGNLTLKPLDESPASLPPRDRPLYVICRLNYKPDSVTWECAEIYDRLPR